MARRLTSQSSDRVGLIFRSIKMPDSDASSFNDRKDVEGGVVHQLTLTDVAKQCVPQIAPVLTTLDRKVMTAVAPTIQTSFCRKGGQAVLDKLPLCIATRSFYMSLEPFRHTQIADRMI